MCEEPPAEENNSGDGFEFDDDYGSEIGEPEEEDPFIKEFQQKIIEYHHLKAVSGKMGFLFFVGSVGSLF